MQNRRPPFQPVRSVEWFNDSDGAGLYLGSGPSSIHADDGDENNIHNAGTKTVDPADRAKLKAHEASSASNPSKKAIQPLSEENH